MDTARGTTVAASSEGQPVARGDPAGPMQNVPLEVAEIISAIVSHHPLSTTLQRIADTFVAHYPAMGIAVFLGPLFHIAAEAGLGHRRPIHQITGPISGGSPEDPWSSCPAFRELLKSGEKLCLSSPLISASGQTRGVIAVFNGGADSDFEVGETARSLGDLALLAIENRELHEEEAHRSQYDRLTGLPNRLFLEDRLRQATVIARKEGTLVGVCRIDLDRFKPINDSLGHEAGDAFFKLISERLQDSVREIDTLARHSGDEFILVLRGLAEAADAAKICQRLLQDLSAPFDLGGKTLNVTASIGISIFPGHGNTPGLLLGNADFALQAAKRDGRAQYQVYSPVSERESRRATQMLQALGLSVARGQFRIVYQPIYTRDREMLGFEALLRWKHPKWGQISPMEFIPLAEKSGLIVPIGDWVIDEVCRQATEWHDAGVPPMKMFANISSVQLARPDFAFKIASALERRGVPAEWLELEITESWVIADLQAAAVKLQQLRDLGIGIAIDDFGTGYSTFNYLQELPLDTLKIDRSFVHRLDGSSTGFSTVRTITELARQLGLKTVAEGVETEWQWSQLQEIGCDLMQGFLLAAPLEPQAACSLFMQQSKVAAHREVSPACLA